MKSLCSIIFFIALLYSLGAAEISGVVKSGNAKSAAVRVEGGLHPTVGDKAEAIILFENRGRLRTNEKDGEFGTRYHLDTTARRNRTAGDFRKGHL